MGRLKEQFLQEQRAVHSVPSAPAQVARPTKAAKPRPPTPDVTWYNDDEDEEQEPGASAQQAGHAAGLHRQDRPYTTDERGTRRQGKGGPTARPRVRETDDDAAIMFEDEPASRTPNSTRRYRSTTRQPAAPEQPTAMTRRQPVEVQVYHDYLMGTNVKARRSRVAPAQARTQQRYAPAPRRRRFTLRFPRLHPLAYIGLTMLACVLLWMAVQSVLNWWDDTIYGYPRIYQCDAVVGHADSPANPSHFIALNLHGRLEVIEFPGGDASHANIYIGPELVGAGQDRVRVTLSFKDVNGDGRPEMLIHAEGHTFIFLNTGSAFRPAPANDHVSQ